MQRITDMGQGARAALHRDLVVIGGSAGALEPLLRMSERLPADFPACVLIAMHGSEATPSVLPQLIHRRGRLPARPADDGDPIASGQILVARPGFHLLVEGDRVRVSKGPRENGFRPAIDPLFRTA